MNYFMEDFWGNALKAIGVLTLITFITFVFIAMFDKHEVRGYYLEQYDGKLTIYRDINWQADESIALDRAITYEEALTMLERLNKTIK